MLAVAYNAKLNVNDLDQAQPCSSQSQLDLRRSQMNGRSLAFIVITFAMAFAPPLASAQKMPSQAEASDYIDENNKILASYKGGNLDLYLEACGLKPGDLRARLDAASFKTPVGLSFVAKNVGIDSRLDSLLYIAKNACSGAGTKAVMKSMKVLEFVASDKEFLTFNPQSGVLRFGVRVDRDYGEDSKAIVRTIEDAITKGKPAKG